ncbi:carbamoyltransferase [Actinophytocola glycyrrhizae]|uniref:Carbamoyltransferase n=1 Tax=Actinophytocola glycyrrhizae TaxID=2044873 RepID=A0ABV9SFH0_9PSEU
MPGLTEFEYSATQGADAAAALVRGGQVVAAAAQERFDRVKHSSAFPLDAVRFCLQAARASMADVATVAHAFSYGDLRATFEDDDFYEKFYTEALSPEVNRREAERVLGDDFGGRYLPVEHHLAHAASAYYPSGHRDSLVVVSDGLGERNSATIWHWSEDGTADRLREVRAINSVGLLYGIFTMYLGFRFADGEYKVMGLAPWGDPSRTARQIMDRFVELEPEGEYRIPLLLHDVTALEKESHRGTITAIEEVFGPRRLPADPIEQRHRDVAAGVQAVLQLVQLHVLSHFRELTGSRAIAMAGGVALNCAFNGTLLRTGLFEQVYVQPASGDDGAALGAALVAFERTYGRPTPDSTALLGPEFDDEECRVAARAAVADDIVAEVDLDEAVLIDEVVRLILAGAVVGWFNGRMEFGPRALGNRSILADPRRSDMRERINRLVKKRESFRPFAPAVLAQQAGQFFEVPTGVERQFREMLLVAHVRDNYRTALPAVTHVDGTARVQTVFEDENPRFWRLLAAMGRASGYPILLNTSFNVAGQPIVCTPAEAAETFRRAELDAVVMGRNLLTRRERTER